MFKPTVGLQSESEMQREFINSIEDGGWENIMASIRKSDELLKATLKGDSEKVAEIVEQVHRENTSILRYNNENLLSCIPSLAYYSAKKEYIIYRELPSGDGYTDLVFVPISICQTPTFIVEIKWNQSTKTAIEPD